LSSGRSSASLSNRRDDQIFNGTVVYLLDDGVQVVNLILDAQFLLVGVTLICATMPTTSM